MLQWPRDSPSHSRTPQTRSCRSSTRCANTPLPCRCLVQRELGRPQNHNNALKKCNNSQNNQDDIMVCGRLLPEISCFNFTYAQQRWVLPPRVRESPPATYQSWYSYHVHAIIQINHASCLLYSETKSVIINKAKLNINFPCIVKFQQSVCVVQLLRGQFKPKTTSD